MERHRLEWEKSCVSDKIISQNVRSILDPQKLNRILECRIGHRLTPGFLITGLDPSTGQPTLVGCQFKPDKPLPKTDKEGNPIPGKFNKYIGRTGHPPAPLFFDVGDPSFWPQVLANPSQEISIIEGAKKAGCLLSNGLPAISIPGCFAWGKGGELHPLLVHFAVPGRPIILWPDSDWRDNPKVAAGWLKLGQALEAHGCVVGVATWPSKFKGIDDLVGAVGGENHDS